MRDDSIKGSAALEFAMIAPVFFLLLIEGLVWAYQKKVLAWA